MIEITFLPHRLAYSYRVVTHIIFKFFTVFRVLSYKRRVM